MLSGSVLCRNCRNPILYSTSLDLWIHTGAACGNQPKPLLHNLHLTDVDSMGYRHGMSGYLISDNPYGPDGAMYDGVDSMSEAHAWFQGFCRAQNAIGKALVKTATPLIDLDYLEEERG